MTGKIYWKLALAAIILMWSVYNLLPLSDTPFDAYLLQRATMSKDELQKDIAQAQANVAKAAAMQKDYDDSKQAAAAGGKPVLPLDADKLNFIMDNRTFFLAMKSLGADGKLDFWKFFPALNAGDTKNVKRRNELILDELLKDSKSRMKFGLDLQGGVGFTMSLDQSTMQDASPAARAQSLQKVIEILSNRLNGLGVSEPLIRPRNDTTVEIQIAGISSKDNPEVIDAINKPAKLEFHTVSRQTPASLTDDAAPLGYVNMVWEHEDHTTGELIETPMFVSQRPAALGDIVKAAYPQINSTTGQYYVSMSFTDAGSKTFEDLTTKLAPDHDRLAIVLDGKLVEAPAVQSVISSSGEITGDFTQKEVMDIANDLNNPLAQKLIVDERYEVGPTLAQEAKASSIKAALLGTAFVVVFMLAIYSFAGFLSVVTLLFNVLIIFGVQTSIGATLTLPGVAALVLTIGMAVDANILIYERMREEMARGKGLFNALEAGHDRALASILDSHVTSIITAVILMWLGTGPIKGFGVILAIGLASNLFCVLVFNHALLEIVTFKNILTKLRFVRVIPETNLPFFSYRKISIAISICIILIGLAAILVRGQNALGTDFRGGEEVSVRLDTAIPLQDIYDAAKDAGVTEVTPSYQTELGTGTQTLKIQTLAGQSQHILDQLTKKFPADAKALSEASTSAIGATVSQSLKWNALLAVVLSLLGVMIYVAFRFEVGYAIGAVVATLHDVIITVGLYVLFGGQFTSPMVAAVLMIIGYSLNDTVIVFDRVREELKLNPTLKLVQVLDLAVNKTFARTTMTSLTVFLSALALFVFGAGVVHEFALVFMIGIATGTASSIFIANPVFYWWHKGDRKHVEEREFLPKYEWDSSNRGANK